MNRRKKFSKWAISLGLLLAGPAVYGQEEVLVLHPPLSQSFPIKTAPDGVHLQFRVLLNDHAILGPNAILRFVYIDPNAGIHPHGGGGGGDGGQGGRRDKSDNDGMATAAPRGPTSAVNPDIKATSDTSEKGDQKGPASEIRTEVWNQSDLFREALDHAADVGTTVVYGLPDKTRPQSATLDFPEGMFLGEADGHVRVLALTDDSRALEGGVQPGDEIRSLAGKFPVATLEDFLKAYASIKQAAKESGQSSYTIEVWRASEGKIIPIQVAAPPSIHSLL